MNCNKKSHFDCVTPAQRQETGVVLGGFGYVSVCKEELLAQASGREMCEAKKK